MESMKALQWAFHLFVKKSSRAAVRACRCLSRSNRVREERELTWYCQVVNYLLSIWALVNIISEASMEMINFKQSTDQSALKYTHEFWKKLLRCRALYIEFRPKGTFIKVLRPSILQSVSIYLVENKSASQKELAVHTQFLDNLQSGNTRSKSRQFIPERRKEGAWNV